MYESVAFYPYGDIEIDKSNITFDPESSEVIEDTEEESDESEDTEEESEESDDTEEDSTDLSEESEGVENDGDTIDGDKDSDSEISVGTSASDSSGNDNDDVFSVRTDGLSDSEVETEEETDNGSHAGSGTDEETDEGSESELSESDESDGEESGSYRITIEGDAEEVGELIRILNGDTENVRSIDGDNESDGNHVESDGESTVGVTTETVVYRDSGNSNEDSGEGYSLEFYNKNLEFLGIIAGCVFFLVFVVICRYIYRFFRLFI